jgi:beta-mannosidase
MGSVAEASLVVRAHGGQVTAATLVVGGWSQPLSVEGASPNATTLRGTLRAVDAERWWPHTHGAQPQYGASVLVETTAGRVEIDLGRIAFREMQSVTADGGFALRLNGVNVFCRGACWTTTDIASLGADEATYRQLLTRARDAGMNMLRVGGTMVYESDTFYDLCDELGILVWQDFMFANMDYPADDPAFAATVTREAENVLARLARHPSLVVLCGNSEVEQQAAMLGHGAEVWSNALFREVLRAATTSHVPDAAYVRGSPSAEQVEGTLPFHVNTGVAHYYGVGAYLRPLEDARRSDVRFAAECLGFANVPGQEAIDVVLPNGESPVHHPKWKSRVPRDHGAGWDFEDVRDHYLAQLFDVDPMRLRYAAMDRYLALSRVVTGEVMARTIGEWRRAGSTCGGALVWFYQDLWLGAGWGVLDANGTPKAAYYALKRSMQPVALAVTDEGANGLDVHIANDGAEPVVGTLRITLYRGGRTQVASATTPVTAAARSSTRISVDGVLGRFHDVAYAYRFGAPGHDVVVATLDVSGQRVADAFHFPIGLPSTRSDDLGFTASAIRVAGSIVAITVRTDRFAQYVALETGAFVPDDNYFHLEPGAERVVLARAAGAGTSPRFDGIAHALNAHEGVRIAMATDAASVTAITDPRTANAIGKSRT